MKYFTLDEFFASATAKERGIVNRPKMKDLVIVENNLRNLVEHVLDPLREQMGEPIYVTSGYRSEELNRAIRGAKNSQHMKGEAADISRSDFYGNLRMARYLLEEEYDFDQMILERIDGNRMHWGWIHVSYRAERRRNELLMCHKGVYIRPDREDLLQEIVYELRIIEGRKQQ